MRQGTRRLIRVAMVLALAGCGKQETDWVARLGLKQAKPLAQLDSGYRSGPADWLRFLDCWDGELASNAAKKKEPYQSVWQQARSRADAVAAGRALDEVERRPHHKLPRSYRDFILASNGSFLFGLNQSDLAAGIRSNFVASEKLRLYRDEKPDEWHGWRGLDSGMAAAKADPNYYNYGYRFIDSERPDPGLMHNADMDYVLYIGNFFDDAELLLNPREVSADGEWEAWELSSTAPGAIRYRSFAEMMQNLYYDDAVGPPLADPFPPHQLRASCARLVSSAGLVDTLDTEQRWQAAMTQLHEAQRWGQRYQVGAALRNFLALDDPRVPKLLLGFVGDPEQDTWSVALFSLGELHAREAIPTLLDLLHDDKRANLAAVALARILGPGDAALVPQLVPLLQNRDMLVRISAIEALQAIRSREAVPPLIEALNDTPGVAYYAVVALGQLRDPHAVKPLQDLRARLDSLSLPPPFSGGTRGTPPSADVFRKSIEESIAKCSTPA